ncbi:MAG: choice-of-anchor Q domain-containing protein [Pseudomonadota bacterium]|nr:choice-of-anchor Q domain-containing protein [Pseudomonadota bacterium]
MQRTTCGWAIALLSMTIQPAQRAHAQEPPPTVLFNVNTVADLIDDNAGNGVCHTSANTCSLRAAIMEANQSSVVAARIVIALPSGIYRLSLAPSGFNGDDTGDLNLTAPSAGQSITLRGAAAASTIIDANQTDRALRIQGGRVATIANITIRNGLVVGDNGGGILMRFSTATIEDSVIEANQSSNGGGITNDSGVLNILRSTVRSNTAGDQGGGIFVFGRTTIRDSALYGNGARQGGGIQNTDELYVINSTLSGNYAYADGGGIFNSHTAFLYNTSIVDNDANHQSVMFGSGGGVFTQTGSRFVVFNTLIVGNSNHGSYPWDCNGTLEAYGSNRLSVIGGIQNCAIPNIFGWALMERAALGPLRDNGGPTQTHALHSGSSAINATGIQGCVGPSDVALATDQRGLPRGTGQDCDIGAFEYAAGVIFESGFE